MQSNKYKAWTTKELNALVEFHKAGLSIDEIAEKLQRTTHAINGKKEQLRSSGRINSTLKHWTNTEVKTVIELVNTGHSHTSIGQAINRTRPSVSNMIKKLVKNGQLIKEKSL